VGPVKAGVGDLRHGRDARLALSGQHGVLGELRVGGLRVADLLLQRLELGLAVRERARGQRVERDQRDEPGEHADDRKRDAARAATGAAGATALLFGDEVDGPHAAIDSPIARPAATDRRPASMSAGAPSTLRTSTGRPSSMLSASPKPGTVAAAPVST